jgi:hypothetical protein
VFGIVESEKRERENKPWRTATLSALILPGRRFRFIRLPCIQVRGYAIDEDESDHIDYSCCGLAHNNRYAMPPHLIVVFPCLLSPQPGRTTIRSGCSRRNCADSLLPTGRPLTCASPTNGVNTWPSTLSRNCRSRLSLTMPLPALLSRTTHTSSSIS